MSKLFSLHGGSLLKPPLYSAQGRHPYEDIKNGGLDFSKPPSGYNCKMSAQKHLPRNGFFLSPFSGAG